MGSWWILWLSVILTFITEYVMVLGQKPTGYTLKKTVSSESDLLRNIEMKLKQIEALHLSSPSPRIQHAAEEMIQKNFRDVLNFKRSRYLLSNYTVTSFFSKYLCSIYRGYLAEINDEQEYEAVKNFVGKHGVMGVFIGMDDVEVEHKWMYSYSRTPAFTKFSDKEPNGGTAENCGQLTKRWNYLMGDVRCTVNLPFICEIPNVN